jgi:predicted nucleic acid-binding Zn ribbon protein
MDKEMKEHVDEFFKNSSRGMEGAGLVEVVEKVMEEIKDLRPVQVDLVWAAVLRLYRLKMQVKCPVCGKMMAHEAELCQTCFTEFNEYHRKRDEGLMEEFLAQKACTPPNLPVDDDEPIVDREGGCNAE